MSALDATHDEWQEVMDIALSVGSLDQTAPRLDGSLDTEGAVRISVSTMLGAEVPGGSALTPSMTGFFKMPGFEQSGLMAAPLRRS